jgi:hypothetical protein
MLLTFEVDTPKEKAKAKVPRKENLARDLAIPMIGMIVAQLFQNLELQKYNCMPSQTSTQVKELAL